MFSPMVDVVPLQIFAYSMARALGRNVDRPRNLAKTVTVE
jgi:glucosamine--fructose-6-phosphate aminotransferase (isomerizing)